MLTQERCQKERVPNFGWVHPVMRGAETTSGDQRRQRAARLFPSWSSRAPADVVADYRPKALWPADCCLDRLMLETTTSSMNRALRNSDGTSIIVRRLRRPEAEDEECNRRNGAAGAVDSENVQGLSLHTSQPSAVKSDDRITLQPEIATMAGYKSRSIFVDPDFRRGLVKTCLRGGNHIEFILNRI
jgi:hypothetical protein